MKVNPSKIAAIVAGDLVVIGLLAILLLYAYNLRKKNQNQNQHQNKNQNSTMKPETKFQEPKTKKDITTTRTLSTTCSCMNGITGNETETATGSDNDHENNNLSMDVKGGENRKCLMMIDGKTELEIETMLKASAYVLGSSGSSIVSKAVLGGGFGGGGVAFAVRRIGESGLEKMKEFENKVRMIGKLRHPNVLRVRGFYWGADEKLVIYDCVSNGISAMNYTVTNAVPQAPAGSQT